MGRNSNNNNSSTSTQGTNQDQSLDPYYVHHSENTSSVLVMLQLSGRNYHSWARKMKRALALKNKYKFVDGTISVPNESNLNYGAWDKCNNLVHSWIINSITPELAESVVFIENAIDEWNDLKDRFMRGDRIRVSQLQQEISNLKQGNHMISEYFTELRTLWEELEQYRPLPQCTCTVPCSCLAMRNARNFKLEDRIIQFLVGLNDEYQGVRSQILLLEPLPQITRVFSMVMEQERQLQGGIVFRIDPDNDESGVLINAVEGTRGYGRGRGNSNFQGRGNNGFQGRGGRGNGKVCTFCGKIGHTVETCYRKHSFPPNFGRGGPSYANSITAEDSDSKSVMVTAKTESENVSLTKEQYSKLVSLLEKSSMNSEDSKSSVNMASGESYCHTTHGAGTLPCATDRTDIAATLRIAQSLINRSPDHPEEWREQKGEDNSSRFNRSSKTI